MLLLLQCELLVRKTFDRSCAGDLCPVRMVLILGIAY